MKALFPILLFCLFAAISSGQVTGTKSIPGDFPSIESAISSLNNQGVGTGGVMFNIAAGYTETFSEPDAGLILTSGSVTSPIVFQKSGYGENPKIIAANPGSGTMDFIIGFSGADYITFDGIDLAENPANITPQSQAEWGFALLKSDEANGSRNVIIKNCSISLDPSNYLTCAIYSNNHTISSLTQLAPSGNDGTNSNNKFYGLTVTGCYNAFYLAGFADSTPYLFYDQSNEIGVEGANTITGLGCPGGTVTGYGIYCSYQNGASIANNSFSGTCANTTGGLAVINLSTGSNSNIDVFNNTITMNYLGTGSFYGIYGLGMGAAGTSNIINIHNNSIINNLLPNYSGGALAYLYISTGSVTTNLYDNQVTGNIAGSATANANGIIYYMYVSSNPTTYGNINIYENIISGNKRVRANMGGGATYLLYCNGNGNVLNENNNTIDSISIGSTGITYGYYNLFSGIIKNVHHNAITNVYNAYGTVYCMYNGNGTGAGFFNNNRIQGITMNSAPGKIYGVYQSSGLNQFYYNNYITELYAPSAVGNPAIFGIYLAGSVKTGAYNNTIYLDASSESASFGTTGIYSSSSPDVELTNNIVVNNSVPGDLGRVVAFQRSSNAMGSYNNESDNNNFYAGIPGPSHLIYFDGSGADETLQDFKARVSPRDATSVTENTPFLNVLSSPYDLHIRQDMPSQCESGGVSMSVPVDVIEDIDGNPRFPYAGYPYPEGFPANAPDIGADEFGGMVLDVTAPNISFTPLTNTSGTSNRDLVIEISDATGVPTNGAGLPVLYWKINNGGYFPATATWSSGNSYSFSFGAGVLPGDIVSYYIVVQDIASPIANVGSNPPGGASGLTSNPPACLVPPVSPYSYIIVGSLAGTYPVGTGQVYPTLAAAISDLNMKEVTAPVTFELWDATYSSQEAFPLIINAYAGMSPARPVTIKPKAGTQVFISGNSATGILALYGADNVIIDGTALGGPDRSLTIENTSSQSNTYVIGLFNDGIKGAHGNTIENCILKAGNKSENTWDIILNAVGGDYDNTVIRNNLLLNATTGIQFVGLPIGITNDGLIADNIFGCADNSVTIGNTGLHIANVDGLVISNNNFNNIFTNENPKGINIGINSLNTTISGNTITGIVYAGTYGGGGKGIDINTGSTASNILIFNNTISQVSGAGWDTFGSNSIVGIRLLGSTGGIKLFFNSVNLSGTISRGSASADVSAAFYAASSVTDISISNNIFRNTIENSSGYAKAFAIYSDAPYTSYTKINNNDYYAGGQEGVLGYLGGIKSTLAEWQAVIVQDVASISNDPVFISSTDLHPTNYTIDDKGEYMSGIIEDIDGNLRTDPPDLGAYEFGIIPLLLTLDADDVRCGSGDLMASVNPEGLSVQTWFDFGPDISYCCSVPGDPAVISGSNPVIFRAPMNIPPETAIHFRARVVTSSGTTVYSYDKEFITSQAGTPFSSTLAATNVGNYDATLHGMVNAHCNPTTVTFEFGLTTDYGIAITAVPQLVEGDSDLSVQAIVTGLDYSTTYHYRCVGQNQEGTTYGEDRVFTTKCPAPVPTITGSENGCISYYYTYSTEPGQTEYTWTVSEGGQILYGDGSNSISVVWNNAGEQFVSVFYSSPFGCEASSPTVLNVTVGTLPTPSITGSNSVCLNSSLYVYTTQAGFSNYLWSVSNGGEIVSGQGTYQVEVSWTAKGANSVSVNYSSDMGCFAAFPADFQVDVKSSPMAAGPVSGPEEICEGTREVQYSVQEIPYATGYAWSLPEGATIISGENTHSILVDFAQGAVSGFISVYGENECGAGQGSPLFELIVNPLPEAPSISLDEEFILHSNAMEGNQWYRDGIPVEGASGPEYIADESGTYFSIVTLDGCPSKESNHIEVVLTGLDEQGFDGLTIYPVPNNGRFTITYNAEKQETISIQVYNAPGIVLFEMRNLEVQGKFTTSIDLKNPATGVYSVLIKGKEKMWLRKILVTN